MYVNTVSTNRVISLQHIDGQRALAFVLMQHNPHSRWNQQITCGEHTTAKITCVRAILALLLIGLQLCLPCSVLLITAHTHYNNWHILINSGDKQPQATAGRNYV